MIYRPLGKERWDLFARVYLQFFIHISSVQQFTSFPRNRFRREEEQKSNGFYTAGHAFFSLPQTPIPTISPTQIWEKNRYSQTDLNCLNFLVL